MNIPTITGTLLDEHSTLTLSQLSRACSVHTEIIIELVDEGVIEPLGGNRADWRFPSSCLYRIRTSVHLIHDLGINPAGAALAVELLEEIDDLRNRLACLKEPIFPSR